MTFSKPRQNLALPHAIRERLDAMFAGTTGLSGREMVKYFSKFNPNVEQYKDDGGMPSRKQILQDCLASFDREEQKAILSDMITSEIYEKYPPPNESDKDFIQQWLSGEMTKTFPQRGDNVQLVFSSPSIRREPKEWDVFISHASEDKNSVAAPLTAALQSEGLKVWFDDFTLKVGDSLRRSIDNGLSRSRFGVVVLSESFFNKHWPQLELDGLVARESNGRKIVLPVWHGIDVEGVRRYSPLLSGRPGEIHFTLSGQRIMVVAVPGAVRRLDPTTCAAVTRAVRNRVEATPTSQSTQSAIADKTQKSPFRPRRVMARNNQRML